MSLINDTHPKAEEVQINLLRQAPPWRKLQMLEQLNRAAHDLALVGLQRRYPQATPAELRRLLASLLLGEALAAQV